MKRAIEPKVVVFDLAFMIRRGYSRRGYQAQKTSHVRSPVCIVVLVEVGAAFRITVIWIV